MHENACGIGIAASHIPSLLNFMNTHFSPDSFSNCYLVDYVLNGKNDIHKLLTTLAEHQDYYGNGIDEPRFIVKNIELSNVLIMGANKDSIKISYNGIDYVKFKDENFIENVMNNRTKKLTVYGRANLNTFMGHTSVQLFIDDYELEEDNSKYEF